jgi:hypothetical protein
MNACMEYCKRHLVSSGFLVNYHFPNKFYISWDIEEIKEYKVQQRKQTMLSSVVAPKAIEGVEADEARSQLVQKAVNQLPPPTQQTMQQTMQQPSQQFVAPVQHPTQASPPIPKALSHIPNDLIQKITKPLPTAPLRYNPDDIFTSVYNDKATVLDNTFFPNNLKSMLVSDIGSTKQGQMNGVAKYNHKSSGKLSLNI